ncbi:MAG: glycosyltransferase family 1 protein, partial [Symploca sp. SIO3E6]|nr:glycosyltransferase family 1 protein [Caldora sp. SIO3E6]
NIVTDGVNGYLFEPTDDQGSIVATQRLLEKPEERDSLRQNARIEAERWGWSAATRQLQNYYRAVVASQSMSAAA